MLDFTRPVGLLLVAIPHFFGDDDKPGDIVAALVDGLPSGSYLVASHGSGEHDPEARDRAEQMHRKSGMSFHLRDSGDFARLAFTRLDLAPPGVVPVSEWRPSTNRPRPTPAEVGYYGGIGRKP